MTIVVSQMGGRGVRKDYRRLHLHLLEYLPSLSRIRAELFSVGLEEGMIGEDTLRAYHFAAADEYAHRHP